MTRRITVTDGRITLGIIIVRDDGFEAITPHDGSLGFYPADEAAARELWRHAHSGSISLGQSAASAVRRMGEAHEHASGAGGV
jgi:hypothetical protein